MNGRLRGFGLWLLVLVLPGAAAVAWVAADDEAPEAAARQRFDETMAQWKDLLARMAIIFERSKTAPPEERAQLEAEYARLVEQGEKLAPELRDAAEKAYLESPEVYGELADLLRLLVASECERDHYEEAVRLATILIDKKDYKNKILYCYAGIAAFGIGEFERAKEWLKLAQGFHVAARGFPPPLLEHLGRKRQDCLAQIEFYEKNGRGETEAAMRADDAKADLPRVVLKTTKGEIELELFEDQAPNTVANFIFLVEDGFYDDLVFFLVMPAFSSRESPGGIAQSGCPNGDGMGDPDYFIQSEADRSDARAHLRGSVSMAETRPGRLGSQFFICMVPRPDLDDTKHTVFGRVIRGMDVVTDLQPRNPEDQDAPKPDRILEAEVVHKRDHPYVPEKWTPPPDEEPAKPKPDAKKPAPPDAKPEADAKKPAPADAKPKPDDASPPQAKPADPAGVA